MKLDLFDVTVIVSFLFSLSVYFQKPPPLYLKIFPFYFFTALIISLIEKWLVIHGRYNSGLVNIWGSIEFCFYFFVLFQIIANKSFRRLILIAIIIYALFSFVNLFVIQKKIGFNSVNFTLGCLMNVIFCIYYLVELFQRAETPSLANLPSFWIATAILFNTVLLFPAYAFSTFMQESTKANKASQIIFKNLNTIVLIIVILTSLLYIIGFLCRIRIRKSSL